MSRRKVKVRKHSRKVKGKKVLVKKHNRTVKSKRRRGINIDQLKRESATFRLKQEQRARSVSGVPRRVKFTQLPKRIQQEIRDDELIADFNTYNELSLKGEEPTFLKNSLIRRGVKLD